MSEWRKIKLEDICKISSGKSAKYVKDQTNKFKVYGSNGIIGSYNEANFYKGYLVGRVGAVGSVQKINEPVWASDNTLTLIVNESLVDFNFMEFLLTTMNLANYATKTAQPLLTQTILRKLEIDLPPLSEQHKIAAILSSVDEAIEKTETIIEQTEKVKKGLMQQLLTKGIGHTKFKKTEIGEIPEEWEVRRLEEICEIRYGKSPKGVKVEYSDYPIMGTSGHVGYAKEFLFSGPMILVGRKGTIDKPIYIERDCWIIDTAYGLFADQTKVSLKWLYYFLTSYDLASLNEATGVPSLNRNSLYSIKVPLPSLNEQNKISNILTSIEQKIETEKEKLSIINEIKKGLMQSLLTGKVRVKVDEDEVVSS